MNSEFLEEKMDVVRERLLVAIDALPDEALLQPNTIGQWSIAELLAHLVIWEAELVTGLMKVDSGKEPVRLFDALADREKYNRKRQAEVSGRDLDRIFEDLMGVRRQLETWLARFSDKQLSDSKRYRFLNGEPLWQLIRVCSFGHEQKHLPELEKFSEAWLAAEDASAGAILLNDIEVNDVE